MTAKTKHYVTVSREGVFVQEDSLVQGRYKWFFVYISCCHGNLASRRCENPCTSWTYGEKCIRQCACNRTNTFDCSHVTGQCNCKHGWRGATCRNPCPNGTHGPGCGSTCTCQNDGQCNRFTGTCRYANVSR